MSNVDRRFLLPGELDSLLAAARKAPRHGHRNYTLLLLMYRHALRVSEAISLKVSDIDLETGRIFCRRLKGSVSNFHPLDGTELRAIRKHLSGRQFKKSDYLFVSERGAPLSRQAVWRIMTDAGSAAQIPLQVFPHMLKHTCGHILANKGLDTRLLQDYMGHKEIQNTVRYTAVSANRFEAIWD